MPTYLLHGFRWPRPLIRIHIILQNLDDAAPEWLMAPMTSQVMFANFTELYPALMPALPSLRFIEQYDPMDESGDSKSQPFAYVADAVHEVKLGVDVDEMRAKGISNDMWSSMVELRDKLAPGEKLSWFVVVCGDVERWTPPARELVRGGLDAPLNSYGNGNGNGNGYSNGYGVHAPNSTASIRSSEPRLSVDPVVRHPHISPRRKPALTDPITQQSRPPTRSLRKFFSTRSLRKSKR